MAKSNSKATIDSYLRFHKKYIAWIEEAPVELLSSDTTQFSFIIYLKAHGAKSQQTVNHYLRSMRVWGNWCEDKGYIKGFKCPIGNCWIHRAKEEFASPEGKALLKEWGLSENYVGIGHCILGYRDCEYPEAKERKADYIVRV